MWMVILAASASCPPRCWSCNPTFHGMPTSMYPNPFPLHSYVIPTPVIHHFLVDYQRNGTFTGFPALGIQWQRMESATLRHVIWGVGRKGCCLEHAGFRLTRHAIPRRGERHPGLRLRTSDASTLHLAGSPTAWPPDRRGCWCGRCCPSARLPACCSRGTC